MKLKIMYTKPNEEFKNLEIKISTNESFKDVFIVKNEIIELKIFRYYIYYIYIFIIYILLCSFSLISIQVSQLLNKYVYN